MVHICTTKLGVLLSCITRQSTTQKGWRRGGGLSWMASARYDGPHAHAPGGIPSTRYMAHAYVQGPDVSEPTLLCLATVHDTLVASVMVLVAWAAWMTMQRRISLASMVAEK